MPASQAASSLPTVASLLPPWVGVVLGFLLVGIAASVVTTQLRAALPEPEGIGWRLLHFLYPSLLGSLFAIVVSSSVPGAPWWERWVYGIVAPYLWAPLYEFIKRHYEKQLGVGLPGAPALLPTRKKRGHHEPKRPAI